MAGRGSLQTPGPITPPRATLSRELTTRSISPASPRRSTAGRFSTTDRVSRSCFHQRNVFYAHKAYGGRKGGNRAAPELSQAGGGFYRGTSSPASGLRAQGDGSSKAEAPGHRRDLWRRRSLSGYFRPRRLGKHPASDFRPASPGPFLPRGPKRRPDRPLQFEFGAPDGALAKRGLVWQRAAGLSYGLRIPPQGAGPAAGGDLGRGHEQELQPDRRQQAPRLWRPLRRERHPAQATPARGRSSRRQNESRARRRGPEQPLKADAFRPR